MSRVTTTLAVVLILFVAADSHSGRPGRHVDLPPLPDFQEPVDTPEVIRQAYEFAALHSEIVRYVPCFCACSKKYGHRSLEDCFIKSRGTTQSRVVWNSHGGECSICITVAQEARRLARGGAKIRSIRTAIERKFAGLFKHHTDTPQPPVDESP